MDEILGLNINEMSECSFECSCGRIHSVDIKQIITGSDAFNELHDVLSAFKAGKVFLLADSNTYEVLGAKIEELLCKHGFKLKTFTFKTRVPLIPDERAVGRLLLEMDRDISVILAVGSGSLNDIARILSCRLDIPYVIAGTAPSMDGYASVVSPLIVDGFKLTYDGVYPYAVLADTGIMRKAPAEMINAGFGDVLGKLTALTDWELSKKLNGEYYCKTSVTLVRNAINKCIDNTEGLAQCDENAIKFLIEALILTGIAMGLVGNSRPASGAEHHLAHFWEMDALARGAEHPLHGNSVGVGTVVISSVYELMASEIPLDIQFPKPGYVSGLLRKANSHADPVSLGIGRELFKQSVIHACEIRERYTILRLAAANGHLEEIANILTERFYG
jgi:glycerol-1-phosphate dehydrogenase [NAD(P)+]